MRRLRVRPSQPNLRGPRESPPGPTTWGRPATGWWERMNAGENPRNQGRSVCRPPLSVSRRRSRGLRKTPRRGADRRAGPRYGSAVPFRRRDRPNRKAATVRRSAQRLSALCPLGAGDIPQRRPGADLPGRCRLVDDDLHRPTTCPSCPRRRASSNHQRQRLLDRPPEPVIGRPKAGPVSRVTDDRPRMKGEELEAFWRNEPEIIALRTKARG